MDSHNKPPTIKDVARQAGVGLGTVSRYLNGHHALSAAAAQKVAKAIETLGYQRNSNAAALRGGDGRLIGLLLPDLDNAAFPPLVRSIERAARADGRALVVTSCDRDFTAEAEAISAFVARRPAGLIMIPTTGDTGQLAQAIGNDHTPVVLLDRDLLAGRPNTGRIFVRHDLGLAEATQALLQSGHRRLVLLHAGDNRAADSRARGFHAALAAFGAPPSPPAPTAEVLICPRAPKPAQELVARRLQGTSRPDAILVGHNRMLAGVLAALRGAGLRPGQDVSVVTTDRSELAELHEPPIAWVDRHSEEIGAKAYAMLCELIATPGQHLTRETQTVFHATPSLRAR